jgi:cytochrome aa3 quinol oxidase subunit IV
MADGAVPAGEGVTGGDLERGLTFLRPSVHRPGFPWSQLVGYVGSLALTLSAYVLVTRHVLSLLLLPPLLLLMAAVQAGLQLGVFMHLRESRGPAWQVPVVALALFTALGLVGMSIWIMLFKSGVS